MPWIKSTIHLTTSPKRFVELVQGSTVHENMILEFIETLKLNQNNHVAHMHITKLTMASKGLEIFRSARKEHRQNQNLRSKTCCAHQF